ncbi:3-dehydroquinate synthase [Pseudidiomarina taiwanensis]|uniref:3-dehydroquinate synthase n=1 Tax=Pseudidiomarina taiwanensis TaxID=337250 RepID=A0A432ZHW1_9GAMM|nr:3-dehydroquinate synthase [Pseudidiomarina taiwanensis]RUO76862.1 3-dehydroquinate synthase [Pseudidiomarina taiwanensis]
MQTLLVGLNERSYPIHIGAGILDQAATLLHNPHQHSALPKQVFVLTNATVAAHYLQPLQRALAAHQIEVFEVPDGEHAKSMEWFEQALERLCSLGFNRDCAVVALGGGVVGDLAGFIAASYQRGVDFYQIPTTLLAQVDSSVGGKTAINLQGGKNLVGAFYQPQTVLIDTQCLTTLANRELSCGLAEVVKYGIIADADFFSWLEQNQAALLARDTTALTYAIRRSCEIKAEIVAEDEREQGRRALLNLGHTFGHAIETAFHQRNDHHSWHHGEAVAVGMVIAARLMQLKGELPQQAVERIEQLLQAFKLPTRAPKLDLAQWQQLMQRDKKVKAGQIRFILPTAIGQAEVRSESDWSLIAQAIHASEVES